MAGGALVKVLDAYEPERCIRRARNPVFATTGAYGGRTGGFPWGVFVRGTYGRDP